MNTTWFDYQAEGDYVPMEQWGHDHWSTLAYLESRAVDHAGFIDNRHMRTDPRLHSSLIGLMPIGNVRVALNKDGKTYPTRLKGGKDLDRHDDWSCLEDMSAAGLVKIQFRQTNTNIAGNSQARIKLTHLGWKVSAALREHRANGGHWRDFEYTVPQRIQRQRTKGWRMPPNTVYVGRPTIWGNPFRPGEKPEGKKDSAAIRYAKKQNWFGHPLTAEQAIVLYEIYIKEALLSNTSPLPSDGLASLQGKNLACWCPLTDNHHPCHADVLIRLANDNFYT